MKYLQTGKVYTLGYVPRKNSAMREQQGLAPQVISNLCVYDPNMYGSPQQLPLSCTDNALIYPAQQVQMTYGDTPIPDSCPCTQFLRIYG